MGPRIKTWAKGLQPKGFKHQAGEGQEGVKGMGWRGAREEICQAIYVNSDTTEVFLVPMTRVL